MSPSLAPLIPLLVIAAGPPCRADVLTDAAEAVSQGSSYAMPAGPLGLIVFGCKKDQQVGRRMVDAVVGAAATAEVLKVVTHARRPNDPKARDGFPSGHAAAAWALAESASMENPKVRPYAYTAAALVTWSRVQVKDHSVLQALAGAALGYALGHASARSQGGLFQGLFVKGRVKHHPPHKHTHPAPATSPPPTDTAPAPQVQGAVLDAPPSVVLWETRW